MPPSDRAGEMSEQETVETPDSPSLFEGRVTVPSGVPGVDLVHFLVFTPSDGLPFDGSWSVTLADRDVAMQRVHFRTLHAAAHYACRVRDFVDWTLPFETIKGLLKAVSVDMKHAEAHAHEIDATWPAGAWMPMDNGPALLDQDGVTRLMMAPAIEWTKDEDGKHHCSVCGGDPSIVFEWMSP